MTQLSLSFEFSISSSCFKNSFSRDALLVCVGDTLNSVLAGFAVFAMIGVLSEKLGSSVQDVIQSGDFFLSHSLDSVTK